jgi:hypothetical protein
MSITARRLGIEETLHGRTACVRRVVPALVAGMLGLIAFGAGGCHIGGDCNCPAPPRSATIQLGCAPSQPPVITTTGPCSVCPAALSNGMIPQGSNCAVPQDASYVVVEASGAGTCHVELTFQNGAMSSVDVDFVSDWIACGSDPHGCGEGLLATGADGGPDDPISLRGATCDAGTDAGASD